MRFPVAAIALCFTTILPAGEPTGEDPGVGTFARTEAGMSAAGLGTGEPVLPSSEGALEPRRRPTARSEPLAPSAYRLRPAVDPGAPWIAAAASGMGSLPTAVAAGDFDEDGVPDIVIGTSNADGYGLVLLRGNLDAIYPHDPAARARRAAGASSEHPFLSSGKSLALGHAVDLLGAGDFDNDGHLDVVVGTLGRGSLEFLAGDGRGGFVTSSERELPGGLTSLLVGDVNRRDGLVDIVAGISSSEDSSVVVFEGARGALRAEPEEFSVPSAPTALALARPDGESFVGIAVGAGSELRFIHGRDRRLAQEESRRDTVPTALVDRIDLACPVASVAWGDFAWEPIPRGELAALTEDGSVRLFGRRESPGDVSPDPAASVVEWVELGQRTVLHGPGEPLGARARPVLLALKVSGAGTEDLAVLAGGNGGLHLARGLERVDSGHSSMVSDRLAASGGFDKIDLGPGVISALPMRLDTDALSDLVVLQQDSAMPRTAITAPLEIIVVDTVVDNLVGGDGQCTLREAITNANLHTDVSAGDCAAGALGIDTIQFSIGGGGGTATITMAGGPLPAITEPLTIDGVSQGCSQPPCIELNGSLAGSVAPGLEMVNGVNVVRGLAINRFQDAGVVLDNSNGNIIEGNHIGTDLTGNAGLGNGGDGIRAGGSGNTFGGTVASARNVISGNAGSGVFFPDFATNNLVVGNYVGTNVSGSSAIPNTISGVRMISATGNTVGGTTSGERNLLSGNTLDGILIQGLTGNANLVLGNFVGTDASGTASVPNERNGIYVFRGDDNSIGGTAVGAGNLVSGNGGLPEWSIGILIWAPADQSDPATGNQILGNLIGTDVTGTLDLGNGTVGILVARSSDNVIGGAVPEARNVISGNDSDGVFVGDVGADRNRVLGNFIGTDITGTAALPNFFVGVEFQGGTDSIVGGADPGAGNLISGNGTSGNTIDDSGMLVDESTVNLRILGNRIGTDVTGALGLGNGGTGITVLGANGNFIGGEMPGEGNTISGNDSRGIFIRCKVVTQGNPCTGGAGNVVSGNRVGTDVSGSFAIPNAGGIRIETDPAIDNVIGGTTPGARNVISGNTVDGVYILSPQNRVVGNYIGTDAGGSYDLGNELAGVEIEGTTSNRVGGSLPGEANVISGNGAMGVLIQTTEVAAATGNQILGNLIGTDASGSSAIGNDFDGVVVLGATNNQVDDNLIAYNGQSGVAVTPGTVAPSAGPATGNALSGNRIHSNGLLGIDLSVAQPGSDGVTPNDPNDPDVGANLLQNFPELSLADATPVDVTVEGSIDGVRATDYRIELFAGPECDGSGYGEGARYLGFTTLTTGGSGVGDFSVVLPASVGDGEAITATATDPAGNTSEFSACLAATCTAVAPFAQTVTATSPDGLSWAAPADVQFVWGDLGSVSSYATNGGGTRLSATSFDIALDMPIVDAALYYLIRPLGCGSWQTVVGSEPGRDSAIP